MPTDSGLAAAGDTQRLGSYRAPAASQRVHEDSPRALISYREPWGIGHTLGWLFCAVWDTCLVLALAKHGLSPGLLIPLLICVAMTYGDLRWTWNTMWLEVGPSYVRHTTWPVPPARTWCVERVDIEDVLVCQRLYSNDGDWAEWTISIRLRSDPSRVLLRTFRGPNETLPEGMERLAEELAYELMRPVTREVRDERKG